jgi:glycosyltransferase involved in cell wall biosynthesis
MKPGTVSVVIPCFNCQATIAETLASVADQTLTPKEVILVDDGSSDQTWELLHELRQSRYPHLMLLSHPGRESHGASMARALGVAHASGEYIAFLDSDDLYAPSKLEWQLAAFERYPEIVMCHTAVQVIGDLDQAAFYETALSGSPESPYWFRRQKDYLVRNKICLSSSLVRADVLNRVPFSFVGASKVLFEDWLCWSLLAGKGRFLYLPEKPPFIAFIATPSPPGSLSLQLMPNLWRLCWGFGFVSCTQALSSKWFYWLALIHLRIASGSWAPLLRICA